MSDNKVNIIIHKDYSNFLNRTSEIEKKKKLSKIILNY